ncbi:MAG: RluA family pseudouridine synthase [Bacteroidales bacterium]|nr:RluA family pseudouridine synthase [Bacteroidales bacterium]
MLYHDPHLMVVNKPPWMPVHPGQGHDYGTLVDVLAEQGWGDSLGPINRLDKNTSGLVIVARTPEAKALLARQIEDRLIHRLYLAVVHGDLPFDQERIEANIGRISKRTGRMGVFEPWDERGKPAITNCRVLDRYHGEATMVECQLETGRMHQIRVHMSYLGHPLFSDRLYGGLYHPICPRQALHATSIAFQHPITGKRLTFTSHPPEDMQALIDSLIESIE